jgi:hypothetical protein
MKYSMTLTLVLLLGSFLCGGLIECERCDVARHASNSVRGHKAIRNLFEKIADTRRRKEKISTKKKKKGADETKQSSSTNSGKHSRVVTRRERRSPDRSLNTDDSCASIRRNDEEGVAPPTCLRGDDSFSDDHFSEAPSDSDRSDSSPAHLGGCTFGDDSLLRIARGEFDSDGMQPQTNPHAPHRSGAELELRIRQQVEAHQTAPDLHDRAGDADHPADDPYCGAGLLTRAAAAAAKPADRRGVLSSSRALVLDAAQAMGGRFVEDVQALHSIPFHRAGGFAPEYLERRKDEMVQRFISDGLVLGGKRCES